MKIRYNKKIRLVRRTMDEWYLESDTMDRYEITRFTTEKSIPIGEWWSKNHNSDLRDWQKEMLIKDAYRALDITPELFLLYKKGQGFNQPHDLVLVKFADTWILSTTDHIWISQLTDSNHTFHTDDAVIGSIMIRENRDLLWESFEQFRIERMIREEQLELDRTYRRLAALAEQRLNNDSDEI